MVMVWEKKICTWVLWPTLKENYMVFKFSFNFKLKSCDWQNSCWHMYVKISTIKFSLLHHIHFINVGFNMHQCPCHKHFRMSHDYRRVRKLYLDKKRNSQKLHTTRKGPTNMCPSKIVFRYLSVIVFSLGTWNHM